MSTVESNASVAVTSIPKRTLWQRIPWLWSEYIVTRAPVPPWFLSVLLLVLLYGIGVIFALAVGELPRFIGDVRYLLPVGLPAFASLTLSYAPGAMERLWTSMRPWLANSGEEVVAFQARAPSLLMRFFWPLALVLLAFSVSFVSLNMPGNWALDYQNPQIFALLMLFYAPAMAYLVAGAGSVVGIGLALFAYHMSRTLDLKRGFIIQGAKPALQPFNQLIWLGWSFTLAALTLGLIANTPLVTGRPIGVSEVLSWSLAGTLALSTLLVPQHFMNRWLAKEKAEELQALYAQLEEAESMPKEADSLEVLRRMHQHQRLVYRIQQAQAFSPTLVDVRFVSQLVTSVVVIVLANIVIRTVFAGLLS